MDKFGRSVKEYMRKELAGAFRSNPNVIVTSFYKLSVGKMQVLRNDLHGLSSDYIVVKNSIARLALKDSGMENLVQFTKGSIGLTVGSGDAVSTFKLLVKFAKENEGFKIKACLLDGRVLETASIERISALPSREVLITITLGTMKAPITNFVFVLKNSLNKLVYCVNAIKAKKEKEGEVKNG